MPAPLSATDVATYPDWTNLRDTWRDIDAEWLRNRSMQIFAVAGDRTTAAAIAAPMKGALSSLQSGTGEPEFYTGAAWQTVRYPNLTVVDNGSNALTLTRGGAGAGVQLLADGSTAMQKAFVGIGGIGTTLDNTGVSIQIGTKAVRLYTDANQLLINSPVNIAGALTLTGALNAPSISVPTVNATTSLITPSVVASAVSATGSAAPGGQVLGTTVQAGTVQLAGNQIKATAGASAITLPADGSVQVAASLLTVNGNERVTGTLEVDGVTNFVGQPNLALAGKQSVFVAGIIAVSGNIAPTQNAPDGTLYVTY